MIKEQMQFIQMICKKLSQSVEAFAESGFSFSGKTEGDRVNGKTAIKRRIIMLRSELLILERMIDNG